MSSISFSCIVEPQFSLPRRETSRVVLVYTRRVLILHTSNLRIARDVERKQFSPSSFLFLSVAAKRKRMAIARFTAGRVPAVARIAMSRVELPLLMLTILATEMCSAARVDWQTRLHVTDYVHGGGLLGMGQREAIAVSAVSDDGSAIFVAGCFSGSVEALVMSENSESATTNSSSIVTTKVSEGNLDAVVAKLDASTGDVLWLQSFGSEADDCVRGIDISRDTVWLVGDFGGAMRVADPSSPLASLSTISSGSGQDGFLVALNTSNGKPRSAQRLGGALNDVATAIVVDEITGFVAGSFAVNATSRRADFGAHRIQVEDAELPIAGDVAFLASFETTLGYFVSATSLLNGALDAQAQALALSSNRKHIFVGGKFTGEQAIAITSPSSSPIVLNGCPASKAFVAAATKTNDMTVDWATTIGTCFGELNSLSTDEDAGDAVLASGIFLGQLATSDDNDEGSLSDSSSFIISGPTGRGFLSRIDGTSGNPTWTIGLDTKKSLLAPMQAMVASSPPAGHGVAVTATAADVAGVNVTRFLHGGILHESIHVNGSLPSAANSIQINVVAANDKTCVLSSPIRDESTIDPETQLPTSSAQYGLLVTHVTFENPLPMPPPPPPPSPPPPPLPPPMPPPPPFPPPQPPSPPPPSPSPPPPPPPPPFTPVPLPLPTLPSSSLAATSINTGGIPASMSLPSSMKTASSNGSGRKQAIGWEVLGMIFFCLAVICAGVLYFFLPRLFKHSENEMGRKQTTPSIRKAAVDTGTADDDGSFAIKSHRESSNPLFDL